MIVVISHTELPIIIPSQGETSVEKWNSRENSPQPAFPSMSALNGKPNIIRHTKKTSSRTEINNQNTDSVENKDTQKASNIFGGQNILITQDKNKGKKRI